MFIILFCDPEKTIITNREDTDLVQQKGADQIGTGIVNIGMITKNQGIGVHVRAHVHI